MSPTLLPANTSLLDASAALGGFSLLSYNILLPNSGDAGWWLFKNYDHAVPEAHRAWEHRQSLLRDQLLGAAADIVCLQEANGDSIESDLHFLLEAGYAYRIHRKYHLRPVTFWRSARWSCVYERHTDKALTVLLSDQEAGGRLLAVVNVHLNAAPMPQRRFRQVFDALDQLRKELARRSVDPQRAAIVVCGDFNSAAAGSPADALLRGAVIDDQFRAPRHPNVVVSSKPRQHPFSPFQEAYHAVLGASPMTLIGGRRTAYTPTASGVPPALREAIHALFDRFSGGQARMPWSDPECGGVEGWVQLINRGLRGSEYRKASAVVEERTDRSLSRDEFEALYWSELSEGKYWSVQHDLQSAGLIPPDASTSLYQASLDRVYVSTGGLSVRGVRSLLTPAQEERLHTEGYGLPCSWHPSDHLPVSAVLAYRS